MASHDWLDGFGGFVGVVEGNGGDIVVEDVSFDDAVEQLASDEAELTVDGSRSTTSEVPRITSVMWQRWIGVLEVSDGNCD